MAKRARPSMGRDVWVHVSSSEVPRSDYVVEQEIGQPPLPVAPVTTPVIFVDYRVHTASAAWLASRPAKAPRTLIEDAKNLGYWIGYLRDTHGLTHPDEAHADVFAATEEHLLSYYARCNHDPHHRLSADGWKRRLSVIKQFHEYAHQRYRLPLPFTPRTVHLRTGGTVTSTGLAPRVKATSAGQPVEPAWANQLVQGAWRITGDGDELGDLTVERDAAFIELALGCGGRRHTLFGMSTYEMPPRRAGHLNVVNIPDMITKNDAGGAALAFEPRLQRVRAYIEGARTDLCDLTRQHFDPERPITLLGANQQRWEGVDHDGVKTEGRWTDTDMHDRLRMLNPDGTSPLLWLSVETGAPLSYYHLGYIVRHARDFVREHINPDFPAGFRTHDLRHTFAVHMAVAIVRGRIAKELDGAFAAAHATSLVADAIKLVCASLGHASETTTRLYLTHATAQLMADIDDDAFLGVH